MPAYGQEGHRFGDCLSCWAHQPLCLVVEGRGWGGWRDCGRLSTAEAPRGLKRETAPNPTSGNLLAGAGGSSPSLQRSAVGCEAGGVPGRWQQRLGCGTPWPWASASSQPRSLLRLWAISELPHSDLADQEVSPGPPLVTASHQRDADEGVCTAQISCQNTREALCPCVVALLPAPDGQGSDRVLVTSFFS